MGIPHVGDNVMFVVDDTEIDADLSVGIVSASEDVEVINDKLTDVLSETLKIEMVAPGYDERLEELIDMCQSYSPCGYEFGVLEGMWGWWRVQYLVKTMSGRVVYQTTHSGVAHMMVVYGDQLHVDEQLVNER
jgi:hypothetical protein